MVVPRNLNDSTVVTVLFMIVSGGRAGGVSPEVHDHLHCFERVELQVVLTAPDNQLFNLLSVSRLVSIVDEAGDGSVISKFQELDRGVFCSAFVCIQGAEQWGENTSLSGTSADGESPACEFAQTH